MLKLNELAFCFLGLACFVTFSACGCATAPYTGPGAPQGMPGIYHRAEKGQTLWRISKLYNADLDELAQINHISDAAKIESGQMIFIPNRSKAQSLPQEFSSDDFIWPLEGRVISVFGQTYNNMINKGINIAPVSSREVVAARAGKVIFRGDNFGHFGKTIIIDHGDGFSSVYARNSEIYIKAGEQVRKGSVIAKAGGANPDKGPYLHFEIRKGHIPKNPYYYLP